MYYRTGKQTICEARPFLIFSPKMLQAGAVKGLIFMRIVVHSFTDFTEFYWTMRRPILRDICASVFVHSVTHFPRTFYSFYSVFNSAPARVLTVF